MPSLRPTLSLCVQFQCPSEHPVIHPEMSGSVTLNLLAVICFITVRCYDVTALFNQLKTDVLN
jgi:hypothetical protein